MSFDDPLGTVRKQPHKLNGVVTEGYSLWILVQHNVYEGIPNMMYVHPTWYCYDSTLPGKIGHKVGRTFINRFGDEWPIVGRIVMEDK